MHVLQQHMTKQSSCKAVQRQDIGHDFTDPLHGQNNPSELIQNLWHFEFYLVFGIQTAGAQLRGTKQ
jgi:hypothetical protein